MAEGSSNQTGLNLSGVKADNVTIVVNQAPDEKKKKKKGKFDTKNETPASRASVQPVNSSESMSRSSTSAENEQQRVELTNSITMFAANPLYPGSRVYKGRQMLVGKFGRDVAIKILPHSERSEQEAGRLLSVEHPNIVKVLEAGKCPSAVPEIFIAMELCSKNLQDYVNENKQKPFDFDKSFSYSKQLVVAVVFIHKNKLVHRDLKPGNILISICGDQIKVADLGLSRDVATGQAAVTVTTVTSGTEGFKAPETYGNISRYAYSADIFPLGICVYFIFTNGKHPFGTTPSRQAVNIEDNVNRDLSGIPQFKTPNSEKRSQLISVLERMLEHKPEKRPTAEEILNDDFFNENLQVSVKSQVKAMTLSTELRHKDQAAPADGSVYCKNNPDKNLVKVVKATQKITKTDKTITDNNKDLIVLFDQNADCLRSYDPATDEVTKFHDEKFKRPMQFSAVSMDSYIYILCANKSGYRLNFRNKKSKWERMQDMIYDHGRYPPVVSLTDSLFVIAGGDFLNSTNIVERFHPSAIQQWWRLKNKPEAVSDATLVSLNDSIFCIGGSHGATDLNSFCRFTPSKSEWVNLESMKHARSRSGVVAVQQRIFVMGGERGYELSEVECYDVFLKQWTSLTPMIDCHGWSVAHHIDGAIILVEQKEDLKKMEKYDVANDRWCKVKFKGVGELKIYDSVSIK